MSDNAEFCVWSSDENEVLENIDKEIKLVSSSSESSLNHANQMNGETWKSLQKNETCDKCNDNVDNGRQSDVVVVVNNCHSKDIINHNSNIDVDCKLKSHFSSNDVSKLSCDGDAPQGSKETVPNNVTPFSQSKSFNSLLKNDKHVNSQKKSGQEADGKAKSYQKVKQNEDINMVNDVEDEEYTDGLDKENYLEEINKRLIKELDEKNALLMKLQENYENLLLKYAEAQNKIDQLRLKSVCDSSECQTHSFKQNFARTPVFPLPPHVFPGVNNKEQQETAWEDVKCQKAVVAPFMKDNVVQNRTEGRAAKIDRPSSLPLETNTKMVEREAMKAGTPTDSEGVSSVITSMSGHSKILNTLDVPSPNRGESKLIHYPERDFILSDNSVVKDAFDKVKNWQNSLPPLELIETPETTLYDQSPMHASPSTNYPLLPSSPKQNITDEEDEQQFRNNHSESLRLDEEDSQTGFKEYLRTLPTSSVRKKNHTAGFKHGKRHLEPYPSENLKENCKENAQTPRHDEEDIPSSCIIQRRRKKPPLLRCSSLPAYDYDSPKSVNRNVYIPPLDLENLTLSDVESYQVEYDDYNKGNTRGTSSSYITSQSGSMEFSSQTFRTMNNSCKGGRISEYSGTSYTARPSFNKSTSITPERCNEMIFPSKQQQSDPKNTCHVCGERFGDSQSQQNFPCRSSSYQSFQDVNDGAGQRSTTSMQERRGGGKHPFHRSVSFNADTGRRCCHEQEKCFMHRRSEDSLEKFDLYASNLKARSQVIMKALAAHVNNS